jgi:hypothetical protein
MQCNIDAKGKAVRLVAGICCILAGVLLLILHQSGAASGLGWLIASVVLVAMGVFAMFESWAGWCALRAMGFRTRV